MRTRGIPISGNHQYNNINNIHRGINYINYPSISIISFLSQDFDDENVTKAAPHRCRTGTRRSSGTSPPGVSGVPQGFRGVQYAMESSKPKSGTFITFIWHFFGFWKFWLVVDLPLWKISLSVGMMTFPIIIWKNKINVPNHQDLEWFGYGGIWEDQYFFDKPRRSMKNHNWK